MLQSIRLDAYCSMSRRNGEKQSVTSWHRNAKSGDGKDGFRVCILLFDGRHVLVTMVEGDGQLKSGRMEG